MLEREVLEAKELFGNSINSWVLEMWFVINIAIQCEHFPWILGSEPPLKVEEGRVTVIILG